MTSAVVMPSPQRKRLDSWKAIAEYLDRNVRTVTRWAEQRRLPVHRVPGGKRQSVFAYTDEIDAWLVSHHASPKDGALSATKVESVSGAEDLDPRIPRKSVGEMFRLAWIVLVFTAVIAGAWVAKTLVEGRHSTSASVPLDFVQLTNDGRAKGYFDADATRLYFDESAGQGLSLFSLMGSGGPPQKVKIPLMNPVVEGISNDGQRLLIASFEGIEFEGSLWVVASGGGAAQRLGELKCQSARWSQDDRQLACVNGTSILIANSDGSHVRRLVSLSSTPLRLAWAPDGKQLIFVLEDVNDPEALSAYTVSTGSDGQKREEVPVALPWGKDCCADWTWVDDRSRLLYLRLRTNGAAIVGEINTRNGSFDEVMKRTELPVSIGHVMGFRANREKNLLYLLIEGQSRGEVLKVGPTKNTYTVLLPGVAADDISYSRDGGWMTFVNVSDHTLWRSRSDGSDALQLTKPGLQADISSWSPDGHTIAYAGKEAKKPWRIFLIASDGTNQREATPGGDDNQGAPSWSPDGRVLVYGNVLCQETQTCWIHKVDLATGTITRLPGSYSLRTARFSPNGKYIAALQPDTHQLLLFDARTSEWHTLPGSVTGDNINWSTDSRFVFIDNPRIDHPVIERIRISDGRRVTVADLAPLQRMPGNNSPWFGLTPDGAPILLHYYSASEIYALNWNFR